MSELIQSTVGRKFRVETCCVCGVEFALSAGLWWARHTDQKQFWCPSGHAQSYAESETDRLAKVLVAQETEIAALRATCAELEAQRCQLRHKKKTA